MVADGPRRKGQGILFQNNLQGLVIFPGGDEVHIGRDILMDGASLAARCHEAVHQGQCLVVLALLGLRVQTGIVGIILSLSQQVIQGLDVYTSKRLSTLTFKTLCQLGKAFIATGLEQRRRHRDRPDAGPDDILDVVGIGTAAVRNTQAAVKGFTQLLGHIHGQEKEGLAGHIHFRPRQFMARNVDGEGIGQFDAEQQAFLFTRFLQPLEHGYGITVL